MAGSTTGIRSRRLPLRSSHRYVNVILAVMNNQAPAKVKVQTDELKREKELLALRKDIAESQKAIAEARKQTLLASLPTASVEPLEGTVTLDTTKAPIESEVHAYTALRTAATSLAGQIKPEQAGQTDPEQLVVCGEDDWKRLRAYRVFTQQVEYLSGLYEQELATGVFATPEAAADPSFMLISSVATAVAKSALDFLALFRTDITVTHHTFTAQDVALVYEVGRALKAKGVRVFYGDELLPLPHTGASASGTWPSVTERLGVLNAFRINAGQEVAAYEAKQAGEEEAMQQADADRAHRLKALNARVDALMKDLSTADATTGESPLSTLVQTERLARLLHQTESQILVLKVIRLGGSSQTKKHLFKMNSVWYSGGAIVCYALYERDGSLGVSGVETANTGYVPAVFGS